jgi:3-methyladenine DNA glycosylase AlkC
MPEPLKNIFNPIFFEHFTETIKQRLPDFNDQHFIYRIFDIHWEKRELKQRIRHIATTLKDYLPGHYRDQVKIITGLIDDLKNNGTKGGFEYIFFPDFIEQFGQDDLNTSLEAMEQITQFISCEFAIRPFLIKYPDEVMDQMMKWSKHPHPHVRRFSSEGCRPRLPWAMAIPQLKKDPSPVLRILNNLRNDTSLFVRKSVANHLNDIAKDHPSVVIEIANQWKGESKETDWIIRHGCRTLLKKADAKIYSLYDLDPVSNCKIINFKLSKKRISQDERLQFSFDLESAKKQTAKLRIEYAIYYLKSNGKQNKKIFQLSENNFNKNQSYSFTRHQSFQDLTTRKHYPGKHKIAIVVNGRELAAKEFWLRGKEN